VDAGWARDAATTRPRVAFVLGGGGLLGAAEVGMLRALEERGIVPDLVLGTSVGALNGVMVAAQPSGSSDRLQQLWNEIEVRDPFGGSLFGRLATIARSGTHIHENTRLSQLLHEALRVRRFEQLQVPFQCVAASIERSTARWFDRGPLIPAVLASSAVPALLPPVRIDGEHYLDGGLVHSIPVGRAVALGATEIYVLQVGRIEQPLEPPSTPWEVGVVAFEIARRHRFVEEMSRIPEEVTVHVLPTGNIEAPDPTDPRQLRYRDASGVGERAAAAHRATATYLTFHQATTAPAPGGDPGLHSATDDVAVDADPHGRV
jgi:NTE family protein